MSEIVYIYADESCLGIQFTDRDSPGGGAGLVEHWTGDRWVRKDYWISEPATTNNRMALRSAIEGLRSLRRPCRVIFTSDSQYLIKGRREWLPGWVRRGWKRKAGPVENEGLWKDLIAAETATKHSVDWRWVRGHAGHAQNEYANDIAIRAAKEQTSTSAPVESGFEAWLAAERGDHQRYMDFHEWAAPPEERFNPVAPMK